MRVIRSNGQNVSPSDDAKLFRELFTDGLFANTTISAIGSNQVSIGAMYGILCGRDFTAEQQTVDVTLSPSGTQSGVIYIEYDTATDDVISIKSAIVPFTPTNEDINADGTIYQYIIAGYIADETSVISVSPIYEISMVKASEELLSNFAPVEPTISEHAYAVGDLLVYESKLYMVSSSIAIGDAIIPSETGMINPNVVEKSVSEWIEELENLNEVTNQNIQRMQTITHDTFTITTGGSGTLKISAVGKICDISFNNLQVSSASDEVSLGTLDSDYFPDQTVFISLSQYNVPTATGYLKIEPNGAMKARVTTANSNMQGHGCYILK